MLLNPIEQRKSRFLLLLALFVVLWNESLAFAPSESRLMARCKRRTRTITLQPSFTLALNAKKNDDNNNSKKESTKYRNNIYGLGTNERQSRFSMLPLLLSLSPLFCGVEPIRIRKRQYVCMNEWMSKRASFNKHLSITFSRLTRFSLRFSLERVICIELLARDTMMGRTVSFKRHIRATSNKDMRMHRETPLSEFVE